MKRGATALTNAEPMDERDDVIVLKLTRGEKSHCLLSSGALMHWRQWSIESCSISREYFLGTARKPLKWVLDLSQKVSGE